MSDMVAQKASKEMAPPIKTLNDPLSGRTSSSFTDHTGRRAISTYWGRRPRADAPILPPQWSFQLYITFGPTAESAPELPEQLLIAAKRSMRESYPMRLDVNFLPDADLNECMEHYRAEKAARIVAGTPLPLTDPYGEGRSRASMLVKVEHADWEAKGATIACFDIDRSDYYDEHEVLPDNQPSIWRDVEWVDLAPTQDSSTHPRFVGEYLHDMTYGSAEDELNAKYYDRLKQGHHDWT